MKMTAKIHQCIEQPAYATNDADGRKILAVFSVLILPFFLDEPAVALGDKFPLLVEALE